MLVKPRRRYAWLNLTAPICRMKGPGGLCQVIEAREPLPFIPIYQMDGSVSDMKVKSKLFSNLHVNAHAIHPIGMGRVPARAPPKETDAGLER